MFVEEKTQGEATKILDDASRLMLAAADLIEAGGLCKGAYLDGDAFCAYGALRKAAGLGFDPEKDVGTSTPALQEADLRIQRALGGQSVPYWNDAHERTKEEVIAKLRAVALGG